MSDGGAWSRYVNTPPPSLLLLTLLWSTQGSQAAQACVVRGKRVVMVTLIIHRETQWWGLQSYNKRTSTVTLDTLKTGGWKWSYLVIWPHLILTSPGRWAAAWAWAGHEVEWRSVSLSTGSPPGMNITWPWHDMTWHDMTWHDMTTDLAPRSWMTSSW